MVGEKIDGPIIGRLLKTVACISLLVVGLKWVEGQVTIVPGKPEPPRKNTKQSKSKPKPAAKPTAAKTPKSNAPAAAPAVENSPESNSIPVSKIGGQSELKAQSLTFVVPPPQFEPMPLANLGMPMTTTVALPVPTLVNYIFDVITSDNRGRVSERRPESARYYMEELAPGVQLILAEVPDGTFLMGNPDWEIGEIRKDYVIEKELKETLFRSLQWETPQHQVKVSAFYMSKYEITQAQWRAVASLPKVNRELVNDPSQFKGSNRPVEKVSWDDAMEFCERLSRATGRRYRLPTEAEWEYACRAGTLTQFHYGATINADWANYHGKYNYGEGPKGDYRGQTVPVGSLGGANAFGLYDMHGNVWEWCLDTWHDSYASAPIDGRPWDSGGIMYIKSLRGGSWDSIAGECRSASRNRFVASLRLNTVGFRVVSDAPTQQAATDTK